MERNTKVLLGATLGVLLLIGAIIALIVGTLSSTPDFTQLRSSVEVTHPLPNGEKFTRKVGPRAPSWVGISEISNHLLMAVIASEDTAFYSHDGVDYFELRESIKRDIKEKRWARGASTITQQLIKNVYLTRQKTLWRKFKEILWARELDKVLSKSEILCFYVNLVEWGPGIYGIKQASNHYFSVPPSQLTARQSAFLAMLLPAPVKYYVYFRKRELSDFANRRVSQILRVMNRMRFLEDGDYEVAIRESLWGETVQIADPNLPVPSDLGGEDIAWPPPAIAVPASGGGGGVEEAAPVSPSFDAPTEPVDIPAVDPSVPYEDPARTGNEEPTAESDL